MVFLQQKVKALKLFSSHLIRAHACIMVSFFQKKRADAFLSDTHCRNILLSLHFLFRLFLLGLNQYRSWRVITKNTL